MRNEILIHPGEDYSTKFSPWLALGCLSPRQIHAEIRRYEKERVANQSTYWVLFELIWRDYFKFVCLRYGNSVFQLEVGLKFIAWSVLFGLSVLSLNGKLLMNFIESNIILLINSWRAIYVMNQWIKDILDCPFCRELWASLCHGNVTKICSRRGVKAKLASLSLMPT